jgi:hypothetical protein
MPIQWVVENAFWLGPWLLYAIACVVEILQHHRLGVHQEHFFHGTELALSTLGSLVGAFVVTGHSSSVEGSKVLTLGVLFVVDALALGIVTIFHRLFMHYKKRPNLRFFVLGVCGNDISLAAFTVTLFYLKP